MIVDIFLIVNIFIMIGTFRINGQPCMEQKRQTETTIWFLIFVWISNLMFKKHTTCNANVSNIIYLVSGLSTPVEMKLKLIPIFRHMHYDLQLTAKVRQSTFKGVINI